MDLRWSNYSESEHTVGSGVLFDGDVSSDSVCSGIGLGLDGVGVVSLGSFMALVSGLSSSSHFTLVSISSFIGFNGLFVGFDGGFMGFVSGGGGLLCLGHNNVCVFEDFSSAVHGLLGAGVDFFSFVHGLIGGCVDFLSVLPGFEGGGSFLSGFLKGSDGELVVLISSKSFGEGCFHGFPGELVGFNGFRVGFDSSEPVSLPSCFELSGSDLFFDFREVDVSLLESVSDECHVFGLPFLHSLFSFAESIHGIEETCVGVTGSGGSFFSVVGRYGKDAGGGDDGDLGEHVGSEL